MFRILREAPLAVGFLPWRFVPGEDALVLVVKGTYRLQHGGRAAPMDPEPLLGDVFAGDDPLTGACQYASDVVPFKPRADAMLTGIVHTPEGRAIPQCSASFSVVDGDGVRSGPRSRAAGHLSLLVSGDRWWLDPAGGKASEPRPFSEMPLGYERAFGGPGFLANPAGKGAHLEGREAIERPLPNIEDPRDLVKRPQDRPAPAGFGPLSAHWAHRAGKWPRIGPGWVEDRWPHPPDDIDYAYFNAAQPALQIDGYLRGDESIVCENLHPARRRYECELPRVRARAFAVDTEDGKERFREVGLRLDTLFVDMEAEKLVLVWRGSVPVRSADLDEVSHVYVAVESVDEPRGTVDHHRRAFEIARAEANARKEPEAPIVDVPPAPRSAAPRVEAPPPPPPPSSILPEAMKQKLASLGYSNEVIAAFDRGDVVAGFAIARAGAGDQEAFDRQLAASNARIKQMLVKAGHDPALADPRPKAPPSKPAPEAAANTKQPWSRARVEAALIGEVPLAGEDLGGLDLSDLDLRRCDLSGAILQGANLTGARLDEATLSGANLSAARAARCSLRGARLDEADLTGAALDGAILTGADLAGAVLDDAVLAGARLTGVKAARAYLRRADLSHADLTGADLTEAHLDGARVDGAVIRDADLTGGSAEGIVGESVDLRGSTLVRLNASENSKLPKAKLKGCRAERSRWMGADLSSADLSRCDLRGADLSRADLSEASLAGSDCFEADFTRSKLRRASLDGANLWAARMEGVDLRRASLKQASLYQAQLYRAELDGADLEGAVTTGTLLDSPVRGWAR